MTGGCLRRGALALLMLAGCGSRLTTGGDAGGDASSDLISPAAPPGSCLIEYNGAFVSDPSAACCVRVGGPNSCDLGIQCNAMSGSPCCLFYSTANTVLGEMCCRYSNGEPPRAGDGQDVSAACDELINYGR